MSPIPASLESREGCTRREGALLLAALELGLELPAGRLEESVSAQLQPHLTAIDGLEAEEREELRRRWREASDPDFSHVAARTDLDAHTPTLEPHWRLALDDAIRRERAGVEFGDAGLAAVVRWLAIEGAPQARASSADETTPLASLTRLDAAARSHWFVERGVTLLGALHSELGRRWLARLIRALPQHQKAIGRAAAGEIEISDAFRARIRELFIALADGLETKEQARRIGLYLAALAAGQRWNEEVELVAANLDEESARTLRHYHATIKKSSRAHLEEEARQFLERMEALDE